jgi:hypothetical protein
MELFSMHIFIRFFLLAQVLPLFIFLSGCINDNYDDSDSICRYGIGLNRPTKTCSVNDICTDLVASYAIYNPSITYLDTASDEPFRGTSELGITLGRPYYYDGMARHWVDADSVDRFWCETRPLVIWIAGSGGGAGNVYDKTSLRTKQLTFDMSGDPVRPGFILVSIQPRNLHWPTADSQDGSRSETFYRDLNSPSTNSDISFVDHIIDTLVAEGVVDRKRIYVMGWSNGARFSGLYSILRHEQTTPGGNLVAAVANYSGGDPYASFDYSMPECELSKLPSSTIPYFMISRRCDLIACDTQTDLKLLPGNVVEPWIKSLRSEIGAEVTWLKIDNLGNPSSSCASADYCTETQALFGHLQWPDGVDDKGGIDHEPNMLQFLADHGFD